MGGCLGNIEFTLIPPKTSLLPQPCPVTKEAGKECMMKNGFHWKHFRAIADCIRFFLLLNKFPPSGLRQHIFTISQFWKLEVRVDFTGLQSRHRQAVFLLEALSEGTTPRLFQFLEAACIHKSFFSL